MLQVMDKGDGWKVYGEMYGQIMAVFSPKGDVWTALTACIAWAKENS